MKKVISTFLVILLIFTAFTVFNINEVKAIQETRSAKELISIIKENFTGDERMAIPEVEELQTNFEDNSNIYFVLKGTHFASMIKDWQDKKEFTENSAYYNELKPHIEGKIFLDIALHIEKPAGTEKMELIADDEYKTNLLISSNFNYVKELEDGSYNITMEVAFKDLSADIWYYGSQIDIFNTNLTLKGYTNEADKEPSYTSQVTLVPLDDLEMNDAKQDSSYGTYILTNNNQILKADEVENIENVRVATIEAPENIAKKFSYNKDSKVVTMNNLGENTNAYNITIYSPKLNIIGNNVIGETITFNNKCTISMESGAKLDALITNENNITLEDNIVKKTYEKEKIIGTNYYKYTYTVLKGTGFRDVSKNVWYYNSVKYCYDNGIIMGTTEETFSPNNNLTRGNLVTILWRMEGSPKVSGSLSFPDVKETDYFYEAVKWAEKTGVVHGYDTGKFGPNNNISREQLATILNNYAKYKKKDTKAQADLTKFTDNKKISSYAREGVAWAVAKKVMSGKVNGTMVDPQGMASRAEAAAMIQNYCNYVGR